MWKILVCFVKNPLKMYAYPLIVRAVMVPTGSLLTPVRTYLFRLLLHGSHVDGLATQSHKLNVGSVLFLHIVQHLLLARRLVGSQQIHTEWWTTQTPCLDTVLTAYEGMSLLALGNREGEGSQGACKRQLFPLGTFPVWLRLLAVLWSDFTGASWLSSGVRLSFRNLCPWPCLPANS